MVHPLHTTLQQLLTADCTQWPPHIHSKKSLTSQSRETSSEIPFRMNHFVSEDFTLSLSNQLQQIGRKLNGYNPLGSLHFWYQFTLWFFKKYCMQSPAAEHNILTFILNLNHSGRCSMWRKFIFPRFKSFLPKMYLGSRASSSSRINSRSGSPSVSSSFELSQISKSSEKIGLANLGSRKKPSHYLLNTAGLLRRRMSKGDVSISPSLTSSLSNSIIGAAFLALADFPDLIERELSSKYGDDVLAASPLQLRNMHCDLTSARRALLNMLYHCTTLERSFQSAEIQKVNS